jgi:hypothetical protein
MLVFPAGVLTTRWISPFLDVVDGWSREKFPR